ncbi:MAG: glycerate kinase [Chloroflexota bacterium]
MNDASRADVMQIFHAALEAADSREAVRRNLRMDADGLHVGDRRIPLPDGARLVVVGAGKGSARMAQAVEETLGDPIRRGFISVKDGHRAPTKQIVVREAGHPLPDERSLTNGQAIIEQVRGLSPHDVALCLLSGGGSALLENLGEGLTLEDLRTITKVLMHGGANIVELNCVRKHLSLLKGGQLARWAQPATVCALILSDVVGDDLSAIASGPTCPDPTTFADALAIVQRYAPGTAHEQRLSEVARYLARGARGEIAETPKSSDPLFANVHNLIIGSNRLAIEAASRTAASLGYATEIVTTFMQGEAREVGKLLAAMARERIARGEQRVCLLAGGETTVTVRGNGRGGRNQELALGAAIALDGVACITLLSAATDGGDGASDAAGAIIDGATLARAQAVGLNAQRVLADNDSHHFFVALGDQIVTGPTLTNVNDVVVMLIE